jgi:hypothetical protein
MYTDPRFASPGNHEPKRPTTFDIITKLLLPGLTLAAFILGQIKGAPPTLEWALFAFTVLLVVFGFFYAPFMAMMRDRSESARDTKVARDALPELRRLAGAFAEFVDTGRNDTFHYIIESELCQNTASF